MLTKDALEKIERKVQKILDRKFSGLLKDYGCKHLDASVAKEISALYRTALSTLLQQVGEEVGRMELEDMGAYKSRITGSGSYPIPTSDRTKGYNEALKDVRSRLDSVISSLTHP